MSTTRWDDVRLVAGREVDEKLHSKAFVLSTLFFLAIIAASIALPALLSSNDAERVDVAAVGAPARALVEATPTDAVDLVPRPAADAAEADRLLVEEEVEAAVSVGPDGLVVTALRSVPDGVVEALTATAQIDGIRTALADGGTAAAEVERLLAPVDVQERLLDDTGVDPVVILFLRLGFGLLFFAVVYQFGFAIAQGVVLEKESRIVELLVSAVPIRTLLLGKVLGIGGLALAQVVLLAVVAVVGAALTDATDLLPLLARACGWFVLFFALGFAMLSCLWAAAGAVAHRTEDLQSTTVPLQLLVILPFFASVYAPDGAFRTVLSFVPFSSPLVMPGRLAERDAALWEAGVAALLLLATAYLFIRLGERLYAASLLRTRGKTSLGDAWSGRVSAV